MKYFLPQRLYFSGGKKYFSRILCMGATIFYYTSQRRSSRWRRRTYNLLHFPAEEQQTEKEDV